MRIVLWGNSLGIAGYLDACGSHAPAAIVAAANRPHDLPGIEALARRIGVPLYVQPYRRDAAMMAEFEHQIRKLDADVFLVNAYSMILAPHWFRWPSVAALNIHAGLLPQYRGANVINWALINGEVETGVTVHHLDAGIDTGDIVLKRRVPIDFEETAVTLRTKLLVMIVPIIGDVLQQIESGRLAAEPQNEDHARHWARRRAEDGRIDWNWPAERIYNLIRALVSPWPGAFYDDRHGTKVVLDSFLPLERVRELKATFINQRAA